MDSDLIFTLEELIDRHGIDTILEEIAHICFAKADHIVSNYQDYALANEWNAVGENLNQIDTP